MKTKEAIAEGRVIVSDGVNVFTGDKVYYNFDTGKGNVDGIGTRLDPWFAKGQSAERISKELYHIKNGYITTCDYEVPHYRIQARDIYIYPGDKVTARHIIFYWGNVPLFYWPYYSKSLKDKKSKWIVIPGYNNKFGAFLLTGYKMWWDDFLGGRLEPILRLDWYQKRGWAAGIYAKYKYKDRIDSLVRSYIIDDKGYEKGRTRRGRFAIDWVQNITEDIRGIIDLNWLSDPTIIYDFFRDEFKDEIQTENYINIAKTTPWYQLGLMVKKRFHNFYTDLERLPELTFSFLEHKIGRTNLLYRASASIGYLVQRFAKSIDEEDYSAVRFDTTQELQYPKKYFGWLTVIPRVGTRQTYWSKRATGEVITNPDGTTKTVKKEVDKPTWRSVYFTGAEFTTKISKVFYTYSDFWQINQLRHLIEPRINYIYQHEPTVLPEELLDFGDLVDKDNHIELGVRNKLQTRRYGSAWDLVDLWVGTNYYPQQYEETASEKRSFSHVTADLELRPFDWIAMDMDANFDQYDRQVDSFNTELVFYKDDKFSFGLGYRYSRNVDKLWTSEINYTINSDWAIRIQHRFELDTGELQEQEYILIRDLHCWNLAFTFREYANIDETVYFIVFYPKAYPDIPITFGTTFFGRNDTAEVEFGMD